MKSAVLFVIGCFAVAAIGCGQTDAGITTSVKSRLAADDMVKARAIDVDTREGVVTLTGEVESFAEEETALQIARSTEGVQDVVDQLNLAAEPNSAPTTGLDDPRTPTEPGQPLPDDAPAQPTPKY
jgi:hypothetical protein